jgi:Asp-tRNA(Asn)/Glu-tRNA(Gln) amidotransferase B subunit
MMPEVDGDLSVLLDQVILESGQAVEDYHKGKKAAFGRIMGNAMKACVGYRPQEVKPLLESKLERK